MTEMDEHELTVAPPLRRKQRRRVLHWTILVLNIVIAFSCFVGSAVLIAGQQVINDQRKTGAIASPTTAAPPLSFEPTGTTEGGTAPDGTGGPDSTDPAVTDTVATFPPADPEARNFLITGSDNGACNDPNSPTNVGPRDQLGERTDTIMVMRVDPSTNRAAVLSFPRDLWVQIAGTNSRNRINAAYKVDQPQRLVDTIYLNFFIPIDHYIQIDFCAFKRLVDAVGGVGVPFEFPARDTATGLDITQTGCVNLDGSTALAYVRSRHYKYLDPKTNKYREDPSSDYGRIARQQDFLRRAVAKVVSQGFDLGVAQALIDVATDYVVTDAKLTVGKQLEFAGILKNLDPNVIRTYRVEGRGQNIGGAAVIVPNLDSDNMQAILKIFQGKAQLETAPDQVIEPTTDETVATTTTTTTTTTTSSASTSSTTKAATTTSTTTTTTQPLETVAVEQTIPGIIPPKEFTCP
jgi:LCP family protein required for cell wall assembly